MAGISHYRVQSVCSSSPMPWCRPAAVPSPAIDFPRWEKYLKLQENVKIGRKARAFTCKSMVQQTAAQGASAAYAKEMERLSAKESLLLAVSSKL